LLKWCDEDCLNVVLTVGGTGFGVRDITPEITSKIIKRPAPALSMAITNASLKITPYAMLSRGVSGIRNQTLIINLPGSEKAACECFEVVAPTLGHAVALLTDAKKEIEENHQRVQNQVSPFTVDTRNVAGRPRESTWPMIEVNTGQKLIEDNIPYENIEYHYESLSKCIGRVLAEDIIAPAPFPPFPAAMKDGYAVLSTDGMDLRSVVGSSVAGSRIGSFVLMPGECMRVNTGCPIPNGADAVVQVEDTALSQSSTLDGEEIVIMVKKQPTAGLDIRSVGSDIAEGEIVLKKNTLLGSVELGLLATLGITQIPVYKLVSVSVISTGDELVEPSEQLADGKIRDSNKTTLMSLIRENGRFLPLDLGISLDNPSDLLATLLCAMTRSDVVVTTGSVSMGDRDYLKHVLLTDLNATIHFGRLNMKPGKPTTFATCIGQDGRKKMVFCLPGNPVSAFVTFHLFVLPALRILSGYKKPFPTLIKVKVSAIEIHPVKLSCLLPFYCIYQYFF
ncbi:hypothetical protein AAG570_010902, partial [Ranatra chinensis]